MYDYGSRKEITVQRLEYTYTRYEKKKKIVELGNFSCSLA